MDMELIISPQRAFPGNPTTEINSARRQKAAGIIGERLE
jgi:hypothetical protein